MTPSISSISSLSFFFILFSFLSSSFISTHAATISLDPIFASNWCQPAQGGCSLLNSSIYSSLSIPSSSDFLSLSLSENFTTLLFYLPTGSNFTVGSLYVNTSIILKVEALAELNVVEGAEFDGTSILSLFPLSQFSQMPQANSSVASFYLRETASLMVSGLFSW